MHTATVCSGETEGCPRGGAVYIDPEAVARRRAGDARSIRVFAVEGRPIGIGRIRSGIKKVARTVAAAVGSVEEPPHGRRHRGLG